MASNDGKTDVGQGSEITEESKGETIDACSSARMALNDIKTDVDQESQNTEESSEETIEACNNVRMASNDDKTEVDQESEITEEITEEDIDTCSNVRMATNNAKTEEDRESENTEQRKEETINAFSKVRVASNDVQTEIVDQEPEITEESKEEIAGVCSKFRMVSNDVETGVDQESETMKESKEDTIDTCCNDRMASTDVKTEVDQESKITEDSKGVCSIVRMVSKDVKTGVDQESDIMKESKEETLDACSIVRMFSKDAKTGEDQESEIMEEITEKTIEANFFKHRSYLEKRLDVSDLIVYYELFTQDERRKLHEESYVSRDAAVRSAFSIIAERTQLDKYTQLLFALDNADCPKLVDLLKGKLVPGNTVNRQRINTATRHICERLTPTNILHYLVSWGVITFGESEKIAKKERSESRTHAALDLLFMLPNRSIDWYTLFLRALVEGDEHTQLAELIDQGKAAQIKAKRLAGMKTHIFDSNVSLQNPEQDKTLAQSYERLTKTLDENQAITTDDCSEHRIELYCDLCYDDRGYMIEAYGLCIECNFFICKSCADNHRKWPLLQKHTIVQGGQMPKSQAYKPVKYLDCIVHSDRVKDHYCIEHNEFTCTKCIKQMHRNCNTSPLPETSSTLRFADIKHFEMVVNHLKNDISLIKSTLVSKASDIENQKEDLIKEAKEERDKLITRAGKQCENTVSMVINACEQTNAYITKQVLTLDNISLSLDETFTNIKKKLNIKFDQNVFIRMQQIVEKVDGYKSDIENLNKEIEKINISFSPGSDISTFISDSKYLGDDKEVSTQLADIPTLPETVFPQVSALTRKAEISKNTSDISQFRVSKLSSLDIRLKKEKETCVTEGIAVTSKGVVIVSDNNNKSVKAFSRDNTLLSSLTFSDWIYGITVINDQTAAVSTADKNLYILNISDPADISVDRSVFLGYWVVGMTHYKGNLIVTKFDKRQCVKMIDLNGQTKWSVSVDHKGQQLFAKPRSVIISTSNDTPTVIVSDWRKHTLTLIDPNCGHLIKTIDVTGKGPHGLTSDDDGNVFVCYFPTNGICVFSPDFEKSRILLSIGDLRGDPTDIVSYNNSDVLYIAYFNDDTVDLFSLR